MTEMMVVGAIIAILTAVAVPNFLVWNSKYKLKAAVGELHGQISVARMAAMNQNTNVTVTVTQAATTSPVTVTYRTTAGADVLPSLTLDSEVSLTNAGSVSVGAGVNSPQDVRFNAKGLRVDTGNANNLCINATGGYTGAACDNNFRQAFNFRNTRGFNYRIVVATTGKVSWCYTNTCAQ